MIELYGKTTLWQKAKKLLFIRRRKNYILVGMSQGFRKELKNFMS